MPFDDGEIETARHTEGYLSRRLTFNFFLLIVIRFNWKVQTVQFVAVYLGFIKSPRGVFLFFIVPQRGCIPPKRNLTPPRKSDQSRRLSKFNKPIARKIKTTRTPYSSTFQRYRILPTIDIGHYLLTADT